MSHEWGLVTKGYISTQTHLVFSIHCLRNKAFNGILSHNPYCKASIYFH